MQDDTASRDGDDAAAQHRPGAQREGARHDGAPRDGAAERDAAIARDAAEEASAFSHPAVDPDVTMAYGDHPDQVIDFYAPREPDPAVPTPLVVVLHGGAWRAPYDRRHITPFADFLTRRGFAVANVEYRRGEATPPVPGGPTIPAQAGPAAPGPDGAASSGADGSGDRGDDRTQGGSGGDTGAGTPVAGRWPDTFDDVAAALDALPALVRAALPEADPLRMVITGHSAGGHLALWAAARHLLPADAPWHIDRPAPLRGVVALAPIADFEVAEQLDVCGGASRQLLGGEATFAERLPYADPVRLLPTGIATTLVQGRSDIVVPQAVAESYADAAAKAGEVVGLTLLEDVGHFPLIDPAADACAVVAEEIAQLVW
ncbi:alpha/beta hydrolase family protein [Streptomyces rhizosphaerihabitans]|uniref:alpha/beta hydrolase family protein n=1 Tax=Streptomyces rhizosphaerihabitans TaxID=1266770 RepID=UPI0021C253FC|nr:alpha/beta hydrolase [Streptomyces rhizosphaerihabitans]MCT9008375.1 alpha/beta hydrolase [Streptomyces rhizosphaerihabitans]